VNLLRSLRVPRLYNHQGLKWSRARHDVHLPGDAEWVADGDGDRTTPPEGSLGPRFVRSRFLVDHGQTPGPVMAHISAWIDK
jgi:hypothetical protein